MDAADPEQTCVRCKAAPIGSASAKLCAPCHAAAMREWRRTHPLTEAQRIKDRARSYLAVYIRRGKVKRQPCERCGATPAYGHHDDYAKPLDVRWLCKAHHRIEHRHDREARQRARSDERLARLVSN